MRGTAPLGTLSNHYGNILQQILNHFTHWRSDQENPAHRDQFLNVITQHFKGLSVLHSSTPQAQFIDQVREETGPVEAAAGLASLVHQQIEWNDFRQFHGAVSTVLFFENVAPKTPAAVKRSLKKLADDYSTRYSEDTRNVDVLTARLKELVQQHTSISERAAKVMATAVRAATSKAADQRSETAANLEKFEELYNAKLALDAPVNYWREKRKKHRILAGVFFASFIIYFFFVLWKMTGIFSSTPLGQIEFWNTAGYGILAAGAIVVGVVIALARILLRLAMSQLHLGNDADERVTMVNTYLALRQGGHATEAQMQTVIERLFAPSSDGIVKDDLGAVTPMEALGALVRRDR